jgi:hypothetical protein
MLSSWKNAKRLARDQWLYSHGLKKSFFQRRSNARKPPLKVYWWDGEGGKNFGDVITPDIIRMLFGYAVEWSSPDECEIIGAGSILQFTYSKNSYVWGSGFISKEGMTNNNLRYCAVRGKTTRTRLERKWQNIPLGDPGILANLVYPAAKTKTGKIGVVAHYVDKEYPIVAKMQADKRFLPINVFDPPAKIAKQISSCKLVVSSSLHGLIFADSFGIPNYHIQLSDNVTGGDYKFRDYCSGVNKTYQRANQDKLFRDDYHAKLIKEYQPVKNLTKIQRQLIKSFPYT